MSPGRPTASWRPPAVMASYGSGPGKAAPCGTSTPIRRRRSPGGRPGRWREVDGSAGLLAVGGSDGLVRVWRPYWDLAIHSLLGRDGINALEWSETGTLAAGFGDGSIMLWHGTDATTSEQFERRATTFRAHDAPV